MVTIDEDEGISYISYLYEDGKVVLWRVSAVTNIAQQIERAAQSPEYPLTMLEKATKHDIKYITEYLIDLDFYEFEREGDLIYFKEYITKGEDVFMCTQTCTSCGKECIINVDQTECLACRNPR